MSTEVLSVRLPEATKRELDALSVQTGRSLAYHINESLDRYLSDSKKSPPNRNDIERMARPIRVLAKHYGYDSISLFGSVSRGEEQPGSDVDFLVEGETGLIQLVGLNNDLEDLLGCPIDVVPLDALRMSYRPNALKEAIKL